MIKKVNFIVNQLVGSGIFLGYYVSNWNPKVNYFLLGRYKGVNLFNVNHIYSCLKSFMTIISDILVRKGRIWVVNERFDLFFKSKEFTQISNVFRELRFVNSRWLKGSLTNFRYIKLSPSNRFPHALVVPNLQNNSFVVNEAFLISIPSFSLVDTVDNPLNIFFPIPGNSRNIRTTYFLYLLISKVALYSRYVLSSSFIFQSYRKLKSKKYFFTVNFITNFLKKYEYISKISYLLKENLFLVMLKLKSLKFMLDDFNRLEKSSNRTIVFSRVLLMWVFSMFFMNILKLSFFKKKQKRFVADIGRVSLYKILVKIIL